MFLFRRWMDCHINVLIKVGLHEQKIMNDQIFLFILSYYLYILILLYFQILPLAFRQRPTILMKKSKKCLTHSKSTSLKFLMKESFEQKSAANSYQKKIIGSQTNIQRTTINKEFIFKGLHLRNHSEQSGKHYRCATVEQIVNGKESEVIRLGEMKEISITLPQALLVLRQTIIFLQQKKPKSLLQKVLDFIFIGSQGFITILPPAINKTHLSASHEKKNDTKGFEQASQAQIVMNIVKQIQQALYPVLEDFCVYIERYFFTKQKTPKFKLILSLIITYSKCYKLSIPPKIQEKTHTDLKLLKFKQNELYIQRKSSSSSLEVKNQKRIRSLFKERRKFHQRGSSLMILPIKSEKKQLKNLNNDQNIVKKFPKHFQSDGAIDLNYQKAQNQQNIILSSTSKTQRSTVCYDSSRRMSVFSKHCSTALVSDKNKQSDSMTQNESLQQKQTPKTTQKLNKLTLDVQQVILEESKSDIKDMSNNVSIRNTIQRETENRISMKEQRIKQVNKGAQKTIHFQSQLLRMQEISNFEQKLVKDITKSEMEVEDLDSKNVKFSLKKKKYQMVDSLKSFMQQKLKEE